MFEMGSAYFARFLCLVLFLACGFAQSQLGYDVVIVGGGVAGLSALNHLVQNNVKNVVLFEAKERFGGRVQTVETEYGLLEMGAQWIHGASLTNSIYNFANLHNLVQNAKCSENDFKVITSSGHLLPQGIIRQLDEDFNNFYENAPTNVQWEDHLNKEFRSALSKYPPQYKDSAKEAFNSFKLDIAFSEGDDLHISHNQNLYRFIPCDIDIAGGNNEILKALLLGESRAKAFINSVVEKIKLVNDTLELGVRTPHGTYVVFPKFVIFTASLGVLKNVSQTMFDPPLPQDKINSMEKLHFGRGVKVFLLYDRPFWRKGDFGQLYLGTTDEDYQKAAFNWTKKAAVLREVEDVPNGLLVAIFGNTTEEIEKMHPNEVGRIITERLRNYTGDHSLPYPNMVQISKWITDPFIRGTYTSKKLDVTSRDFEIMSKPHMNGRLLFAGEAYDLQYHSTMHGARNTGVKAAEQITRLLLP